MRPARREISIFNVSTIDLFASALGAFMVVSLLLLPYFPNTGEAPPAPDPPSAREPPAPPEPPPAAPEPPAGVSAAEHDALTSRLAEVEAERDALGSRLAEAETERNTLTSRLAAAEAQRDTLGIGLADARAERDAARDREQELEQALAEAESTIQKLPPIDLVIALDTTGSMTNEVASLREEIAGLTELLVNLAEDAAVGIIDFKDRCDPRTALRVEPIQRIDRESVRRLTSFARSMSPGGSRCNDTGPEDFAEALRAALGLRWRADAERRSIVMISDNPAHENMVEQAVADAGRFAARTGAQHTVSTVFVDTSDVAPTHPYIVYTVEFMRRVADAGRGEFVAANENASLSLTILHALFGD